MVVLTLKNSRPLKPNPTHGLPEGYIFNFYFLFMAKLTQKKKLGI